MSAWKNNSLFGCFLIVMCVMVAGCTQTKTPEMPLPTKPAEAKEEPISMVDVTSTFKLPILNIHHVASPPSYTSEADKDWYISTSTFERVLQRITEKEYVPITISELSNYLDQGQLPEKAMMITFDDGWTNLQTNALPLLKKHEMKAVAFIMSKVKGGKFHMTTEDRKDVLESGHIEFQSHTRYHKHLTRISPEDMRFSVATSKKELEEELGIEITALAYPFGLYNKDVMQALEQAGYTFGLTIKPGETHDTSNLFDMNRIIITERSNIEEILP